MRLVWKCLDSFATWLSNLCWRKLYADRKNRHYKDK